MVETVVALPEDLEAALDRRAPAGSARDEVRSLPKAALTNYVGPLSPAKLAALYRALAFAAGLAGDRSKVPS